MKTLDDRPGEPLWRSFERSRFTPTDILDHFGVRSGPVDVFRILMESGVFVHYTDSSDFSGASKVDEEGNARIWVNKTEARVRQRFTAAHEFGHILLHEGLLFRDYVFVGSSDPLEWAANKFAAELLMPEWLVKHAFRVFHNDVKAMAKYFDVSEAAMGIRNSQINGMVR